MDKGIQGEGQAPSESSVLGPIAGAMAAHRQEPNRNAEEVRRVAREAADALRAAQDLLLVPATGIAPLPSTSPPPGAAPLQPPGAAGAPMGARCPLA